MGRPRKYFTEEERKAAQRERNAKRYQKNRNKILAQHAEWRKNNPDYNAEYYQTNKEKIAEKKAEYYPKYYQTIKAKKLEQNILYRKTLFGRANNLLNAYKQSDKKYNRGECTLTEAWIVENIFNQPCHYCGETDWTKIGCDRKDSSLPHTPDNVVPCCKHCNEKKGTTEYEEYLKLIGKIA